MALSTRDCGRLRATRTLPELPYRKVPDDNPTGTNMPSASLASVHAAAAKSGAPPPSTSQPQSETHVFPFSQHKQAVTLSDNVSDPSADTSHSKRVVIPGLICRKMPMILSQDHRVALRGHYLHPHPHS